MSARTRQTFLTILMLFSLSLQPLAASAALSAQANPAPAAQAAITAGPGALFRATVTVDSPSRRARLEALGVVVVREPDPSGFQKPEGSAVVVLADAEQLEALARLGFRPQAADELGLLVAAQGPEKAWLAASLRPLLAQADAVAMQRAADPSGLGKPEGSPDAALRAALAALTPEQRAAVADSISVDDDADGLTNTQEAWWCTDPMNPDTDADGRADGAEIQALKDWLANKRAGPPGETPWPSWPFNDTTCPDKDHDSIPNLAERWELGLNMDLESSDRDKFDDGQELFGVTYCPGGDLSCGYGDLPRSSDSGYVGAVMPSWVVAPGNHPLVAAFPVPEVDVVESSLKVQTVTTVTTDHTIGSGTEKSYSTAKTEGTSTSVADTVTWNEWQEVSIATTTQAPGVARLDPEFNRPDGTKSVAGSGWDIAKFSVAAGAALCVVATLGGCAIPAAIAGASVALGDIIVNYKEKKEAQGTLDQLTHEIQDLKHQMSSCNPSCKDNVGEIANDSEVQEFQRPTTTTQDRSLGNSTTVGLTQDSSLGVTKYYQTYYPQQFVPTKTTTNTSGKSWGGAQTTTNTQYEEHTITNGEAFSNNESWGNATAQDSAHAADLWFSYKIENAGTDYAKQICNLAFNVYIGDDPNPAATYFVGPDLGGDGCFHNFEPGEAHAYSFPSSSRIKLTLEQLKAIDLGGPVRVVVEDYVLGADDHFRDDAFGAGVMLTIEDGSADGDEAIDTYLIPTWGNETVLDVLGRYFPHTTDAGGMLTAVWTPEYRSDTPAWCVEPRVVGIGAQRTLWCKHALSTADWWNIYTDGMGDGSEGFQHTLAAPGQTALFRFNSDSDLDGYSDRSEERLGTDPHDPASFPRPELIAGVHSIKSGNQVTATLSLLNTGVYDAYGVEAVMIAPDDSVSITNNTVGGSGRVRAQKQVIVGSRIAAQTPLPAAWLAAGHAQPAAGGYYTGAADRTYTFTAAEGGSVGTGTLRLNWNDGAGGSGTLNFGAGYASPTLLDVSNGVKLGLLSGTLAAGESFTLAATTPRDTFQYTIAAGHESDFTSPVVLVSYNDPQGNHRFVVPPAAMGLGLPTDDLMAFSNGMLQDPGVEIVTAGPFSAGANTTDLVVNNPTQTAVAGAHLFLEFIDPEGAVVLETSVTTNLPAGPSVVPVAWDSNGFDPAYDPTKDYIVMAFWTDYQGNILDTAARPLSSFQEDPKPAFAMADTDATWDFGTASQGTLLTRSFTLANIGQGNLMASVINSGGRWDRSVNSLTPNWIDTGITVQSGEQVGFRAGGIACYATAGTALCYGPDGRGDTPDNLLTPGLSVLSLVGKIGDGTPFLVGQANQITADRSGRLYLATNDCIGCYADNGGVYSVHIEVYGLPTDGERSLNLASGDTNSSTLLVNTHYLPVGLFERDLVIRTSDPNNATRTVHVVGTITDFPADTAPGVLSRLLDVAATVSGTQGQWVEFAHTLEPEPQTLHPVKIYDVNYSTLQGVGKVIAIPTVTGVTINATVLGVDAGCHGDFGIYSPINQPIFQDYHNYVGQTRSANYSGNPTSELYYIWGGSCYGGPHLSNSERARVTQESSNSWVIGWDDTLGDRDYNDLVVRVTRSENVENLYIAEQSAPTTARLKLPGSSTNTYQVQYGRKLNWSGAANQVTSLRVPAGLFTSVTLQALVSGLPSNAWFALDVGNTGTDSWNGTVGNGGEYTSPNLAAFFNAYWASHGAPTTGTLDVPIRVYLDRAGQVLLTNLQVTPTGSKTRYVRVGADGRPPLQTATLNFLVSGGSGPLTVGVDVGADGTVDWPGHLSSPAYPASVTTGNLAAAINAYLNGKSGEVDVPIRIYLAPFQPLALNGFSATPVGQPDAQVTVSDVPSPTEGDTITVNAAIYNPGSLETGPLTAAFYAVRNTQYADYIGSTFVPNVTADGSYTASLTWNTLGFTGEVPVRVVVDPYNRVAELSETNNEATAMLTIRTRSDLSIPTITLSDAEPVTGRPVTVTVTVRNTGQTAAASQTTTLYNGHPDAGGTALGSRTVASIAGGGTRSATFTWTPAQPGAYRLAARADRTDVVKNESNEGNNDRWLDVYVGFGAPIALDSGTPAADPLYTAARGYGTVDTGEVDAIVTCAGRPDPTLRRDPTNRVGYRFDHLQPGRFYHLDVILYECDNNHRVQRVLVDDMLVGGPVSLGDQADHPLSIRLDPALYRDREIQVAVIGEDGSQRGAVAASVALREIDYRYADSGGPGDLAYTPQRGWGYLAEDNTLAMPNSLPSRSARVNQAGPEVRYRFDRLDPAKRYQVALTFWQATGNPLQQRVRVDGLDAPATVNVVAGTAANATVRLSPLTYAEDGSVVVSVAVLNAETGAMVNEISLEEETLLIESPCRVRETAQVSFAYGSVIANDVAAPAGTVVTAHNPAGEIAGCYVVGAGGNPAGQYGFMPIYGEDANATPAIPGMKEGELVTFRVDGALAAATPAFYWHNDLTDHRADLIARRLDGQSILLPQAWNLLSFRLEPPVPLLDAVFGSIAGKYDRVLGEGGIYDADIPPQFRTLAELHAGRSYYVRLDGVSSANLLIEGSLLPAGTPLPLHAGWNWTGYLPQTTLPITVALDSISGSYQRVLGTGGQFYDVRNPAFSTLKQMAPGQGYRIYATAPVTLTYPAAAAATVTEPEAETPEAPAGPCRVTATPSLTLLFGALTINDQPAAAGTLVEALTPRGETAGCFVVETPGQYGFMPLFGEDPTATPPIPGFRPDEPIRLRINGLETALAEAILWQDDLAPRQADLAVTPHRDWLPLIAR